MMLYHTVINPLPLRRERFETMEGADAFRRILSTIYTQRDLQIAYEMINGETLLITFPNGLRHLHIVKSKYIIETINADGLIEHTMSFEPSSNYFLDVPLWVKYAGQPDNSADPLQDADG